LLPIVGGVLLKQFWGPGLFKAHFRDALVSPTAHINPARLERYYDVFNSPAARNSALATLRATLDARPVVAQTGRIQARTLVIWGRSDRMYPASFGQRLAREIRGAGFEILDSGHSPQEECPAELARIIARFLK
jgi:pimeloyl-ACP methyl ester carboxylesterase